MKFCKDFFQKRNPRNSIKLPKQQTRSINKNGEINIQMNKQHEQNLQFLIESGQHSNPMKMFSSRLLALHVKIQFISFFKTKCAQSTVNVLFTNVKCILINQ